MWLVLLLLVLGWPTWGVTQGKTTATYEDLGICNPLLKGTAFTSATLLAAINSTSNPDCTGNKVLLIPPGIWVINASLLIPDRFAVQVPQGAIFSVSAGQILTLDCKKILSSTYPVFTGPGTVTCSNAPFVVPYAASLTFLADVSPVQAVTLTGNVTSIALSQGAALLARGSVLWLRFSQDATGGRTVTGWPGNVLWASGSPPVITATGGATSIVALLYDGANWRDFLVNLAPAGGGTPGSPLVPWTIAGSCSATQTMIPAAAGASYVTATCQNIPTACLHAALLTAPLGWTWAQGLVVRASAIHTGSPAGEALGVAISAQCRTDNSVMNNTWGSGVQLAIPFTTVNRLEIVQSGLVTPEGGCTGGTEAAPLKVNVRVCIDPGVNDCVDPSKCHVTDLEIKFLTP